MGKEENEMEMNVKIQGLKFRTGEAKSNHAGIIAQRLANNGARGFRPGDVVTNFDNLKAQRQLSELQVRLVTVATLEVKDFPEIQIENMATISDGKVRIMKKEVTLGLFKHVMGIRGYEITRSNSEKLKALLCDASKAGDTTLTYVSLLDAREFAKRLSDLTGRKFRVQTEAEFLEGRANLSGNNWTWTETKHYNSTFILSHQSDDFRAYDSPVTRYSNYAVRLVEDIGS